MIKNLLFDMGGVILPMRPVEEAIRRFSQIGLRPEVGRQYLARNGQKGIFMELENGTLSADEFLEKYYELTGYRTVFEDIEWAWQGFVMPTPPERLLWLEQLRGEGYHLALASNTNPFLQRWEESSAFTAEGKGIGAWFDRLWYSYELKAYKPGAEFFLRMMEKGGYHAEECLFLDDALHNVEAARACGMRALHVPDNMDWLEALQQELVR